MSEIESKRADIVAMLAKPIEEGGLGLTQNRANQIFERILEILKSKID